MLLTKPMLIRLHVRVYGTDNNIKVKTFLNQFVIYNAEILVEKSNC